jgi:hypothetical protein
MDRTGYHIDGRGRPDKGFEIVCEDSLPEPSPRPDWSVPSRGWVTPPQGRDHDLPPSTTRTED